MFSPAEGVGEVREGGRLLGPVRFWLEYPEPDEVPAGYHGNPHATIKGMSDPPSGRLVSLDGAMDVAALYFRAAELSLHFDGHSMPFALWDEEGGISGMGGWFRREQSRAE